MSRLRGFGVLEKFATKKAERGNLRVALRDKYRLPEVRGPLSMVQTAGEDLDHAEDLEKMVEEEEKEEENNKSFLGKIQDLDVDIKTRGHHDGGEAGRRGEEHWDVNAVRTSGTYENCLVAHFEA
ncbi:complexin-4-like [Gadus morhua]|uniref:complexin-4-like n=1 Tax=Gadus morhua TaxID=8049 RepID=UPI0011B5FDB0|nr:complexin-4-like [Gadus morhua]